MRVVKIVWLDHCSFGDEWLEIENFKDKSYSPTTVTSYGVIIKEEEKYLILTGHHSKDMCHSAMCILKKCIVSREELQGE